MSVKTVSFPQACVGKNPSAVGRTGELPRIECPSVQRRIEMWPGLCETRNPASRIGWTAYAPGRPSASVFRRAP